MPIKNKKNLNLAVVLIGIILGVVGLFSPASFAMIMLMLLICAVLWNLKYSREEKKFLLKLFIGGWAIRMVICLGIYAVSKYQSAGGEGALFYDDKGWPQIAWLMYQSWLGKFDLATASSQSGLPVNDKEFYLVLISLLFSVFRYYTPLIAKYLNIIFSCLTAIIIYDLGRQIFNQKTAKIGSVLTMFMPSLIIWSVAALKETSFIFLVTLWLWALVKFFKYKKWYFILLFLLAALFIYSIRSFFLPLILVTTGAAFVLDWGISLVKKTGFLFVGVVIICILLILTGTHAWPRIKATVNLNLDSLKETHRGYVHTGGLIYKSFDDRYYGGAYVALQDMPLRDILKWYLKGITYLTFVPLPWRLASKSQLIFMPQIVVWYSLVPFTLIGIICGLRYRWREVFPLIFFLLLGLSIYGLAEANIGTAVRHRDILTPFYMIFAAVGLRKVLGYPFLIPQKSRNHDQIERGE